VLGALVLAGTVTGCTTVQVAQRDGCWVRETKQTFRGKKQEVGPCLRAQPAWVEDRLTRLVQECIAQADWRWQVRALDAWSRKQPIPPQEAQEAVIETCMNEAAGGTVAQNETLRARLAEVSSDREALRADAEKTSVHLRASNERLAEFLGEAAKRPPPVATATATATSDGTATTENGLGLQAETGSASHALPAPAQILPVVPAAQPAAPPAADAPPAPAPQASPAPEAPQAPKALKQARAPRKPVVRPARRALACELPAAAACPATTAAAPESPAAVATSPAPAPPLPEASAEPPAPEP
jgi:hypothetical protein